MTQTEMILIAIQNTMTPDGKFNVIDVASFCRDNYDNHLNAGQVTRGTHRLVNQGHDIRPLGTGNDYQLVATAAEIGYARAYAEEA